MKFRFKNKRGSVIDILIWMILSFVLVVFFAGWIYGFNQLTNTLAEIDSPIGGTNLSDISRDIFGQINPVQTRSLHVIAVVMIIMMGLSIMLSNFIIRTHPAFFMVYLMVVIGAIMASAILANLYEKLLTNATIGSTLGDFTVASFILINFPIFVTVFGLFGALFLFSGILRDAGVGGEVA